MPSVTYASSDSLLESLVLHMAPDYAPNSDGILNGSALMAYLKMKDRIELMDGGLEIVMPVITSKNTNMGWRSHTESMPATLQDPTKALRYDIQTMDGAAVVINKKHEAMNKGKAMIKNMAKTLLDQTKSTVQNEFNSAWWASSVAENYPNSLPSLISATPTTGTIGGQSRSSNKAFQNKVDTATYTDLGSEAGLTGLTTNILTSRVAANDRPDLVIMGDARFAGLSAYVDTLRRFQPNDKMADLGFDTMKVLGATLVAELTSTLNGENTINEDYVYGINSNYMKLKVLKDGNFSYDTAFKDIPLSLNRVLYFYFFGNLADGLPRAHFLMTTVTG
jgi:hypothetical protein